jgi:hypothetical protein
MKTAPRGARPKGAEGEGWEEAQLALRRRSDSHSEAATVTATTTRVTTSIDYSKHTMKVAATILK